MVKQYLKGIIIMALSTFISTLHAQTLSIVRQGQFAVGGTTVQHPGAYDNSQFISWSEQVEAGQSYRADHAFVSFQVPKNAQPYPLVYVHGYGQSGMCWQTTPDGRAGFATLMLQRGWSSYVVDLPGRGRASRTTATTTMKPTADEMFWFDVWRMGQWPEWNEGVQFPQDSESMSNFFRQMVPDLSDHKQDVPSLKALAKRIGGHILVTHSAGGLTGWLTAIAADGAVKAIASYEPGAFVFPEGEVPAPIPSRTGGAKGTAVSQDDFMKLTRIPIVLYYGDYIVNEASKLLGDENWRARFQMARHFVDAINRHGGKAELVELPKLGIKGNTHFLMQERNNAQLADLLNDWLCKNVVAQPACQSSSEINHLCPQQQAMVAIAAFEAKGDKEGLMRAINDGLDAGLTISEIKEALVQLYAYTGFPRSLNALNTFIHVLDERSARGITTDLPGRDATPLPADFNAMAYGTEIQKQVTARSSYYFSFSPALDGYLKAHLFGDIFARDNLTHAQRELVTVSALSAIDGLDSQLRSHVKGAKNMGLSDDEIHSVALTLRQKVGNVEGYRAAKAIADVYGETFTAENPRTIQDLPLGEPNAALAQYFSGNSYVARLSQQGGLPVSNVTFEPGCRNNWHIHHGAKQVLIVTSGTGWYQEWGKPARRLNVGDVVEVPEGTKHWHGAARDSWFQHIAFSIKTGKSSSNEWLEAVTDEEYNKLK